MRQSLTRDRNVIDTVTNSIALGSLVYHHRVLWSAFARDLIFAQCPPKLWNRLYALLRTSS